MPCGTLTDPVEGTCAHQPTDDDEHEGDGPGGWVRQDTRNAIDIQNSQSKQHDCAQNRGNFRRIDLADKKGEHTNNDKYRGNGSYCAAQFKSEHIVLSK